MSASVNTDWTISTLKGRPEPEVFDRIRKLAAAAEGAGADVIVDDRAERPGVKFKDADLIGIPYQLIVGPRGLKEGMAEIKHRKSGERETLPIGDAVKKLVSLIVPQRLDTI